uniref:Uncharacterized protein n=1 Tax=Romanomermis culicivorax TaxID=13658 RepID=A0A915JTX3_ROMCU
MIPVSIGFQVQRFHTFMRDNSCSRDKMICSIFTALFIVHAAVMGMDEKVVKLQEEKIHVKNYHWLEYVTANFLSNSKRLKAINPYYFRKLFIFTLLFGIKC